jgi:alpha-1,2-mannosyltransferase
MGEAEGGTGLLGAVRRHPLGGIVVLGLLVRTAPWWAPDTFLGVMEYDDGVYYSAAKLLMHGLVPYRDVTIVHPPVLTLVLLPFAALGQLFGDPVGLASARVGMQLVAAANIVLVHRLALHLPVRAERRQQAALLAAGLYAVMPNAVIAEQTILLEPLVNLACLAGVYLLVRRPTPSGRAAFVCGVLLVAGIGVKIFAGAYVLAVLAWLVTGRRWRLLPPFAGGLAAGAAVLLGPFVALAPTSIWHDVVVTQLSRPTNTGVVHGLSRATNMLGLGWVPTALGLVVVVVLLVCGVGALRREPSGPVTVWLVLTAVSGAAILWAPTYFLHYGAFLAPPVALMVSQVAASRSAGAWEGRMRVGAAAVTAIAFCIGTGWGLVHIKGRVDLGRVHALVPAGSCVYYDAVSLALAADVFRDPSAVCPSWVDGRGVALTQSTGWPSGVDFYPAGFVADSAWQAANVQQMQHAGYLLLRHDPATFPEWTKQTRQYVVSHFSRTFRAGSGSGTVEFWTRVSPG